MTIITACYNALRHLPETSESILTQSFTNWQWIIADDGSTDGSAQWIEELARREPRVRLLKGAHEGKSRTLNRTLAHISGEYVALCDADDLWLPTKLDRQLEFMQANPAVDITYTWAEEFWSPEAQADGTPPRVWPRIPTPPDMLTYLLATGQPACNSSLLFRTPAFLELGGLNPDVPIHDDYELMLRAARQFTIKGIAEVLVRYRISPSARTSTRTPERLFGFHEQLLKQGFESAPAWHRYLANHHLRLAEYAMEGALPDSPRRHLLAALRSHPSQKQRWPLLLLLPLPRPLLHRAYAGLKRLQARLAPGDINAHRMAIKRR